MIKCVAWYGLTLSMRKGYCLAIDSFKSFCILRQQPTWPAAVEMLEEWIAYRIYGSTIPKQSQVKSETMSNYLSAPKLYHIDCHLSLKAYDTPRIAFIIMGRKRLLPKQKVTRLPITKDILKKITENKPVNVDGLNIDMVFKVAWAGFLRLGKITYTGTEFKKASFLATRVTRSDISFSKGNQYTMLCFKQSKTKTKHTSILIVLAAIREKTCPVAILACFDTLDPQPANVLLFCLSSGAFSRFNMVTALKKCLSLAGLE